MREKWFTRATIRRNARKRYQAKDTLFNKPHKWFTKKDVINQRLITTSLNTTLSLPSKIQERRFLGIPICKKSSPEIVVGMFQRFDNILTENKLKISLYNKNLLYERCFFPYLKKKQKQSHIRSCDKLSLRDRLMLESPLANGISMSLYHEVAQHNILPQEEYHKSFPHILQIEYDKYVGPSSRWLHKTFNQDEALNKSGEMMNQGIINGQVVHRLLETHRCFNTVNKILSDNTCIFEDTPVQTIIDIIDGTQSNLTETELVLKEIFPFASSTAVQENLRRLIPVYLDIANDKLQKNTRKDIRYNDTCPLYQILGEMRHLPGHTEVNDELFPEPLITTSTEIDNLDTIGDDSSHENSDELLHLSCLPSPEEAIQMDDHTEEIIQVNNIKEREK